MHLKDRRTFLMPHRGKHQHKMQLVAKTDDAPALSLERFESLRQTRALNPPVSGLEPYAGPWTRAEVTHLLRRTLFGATQEDVTFFAGLDLNQSVAILLDSTYTPPAPPVNDYNSSDFTDPDIPFGQSWVDAFYNPEAEGYRIESLRAWWLRRMMNHERNIREKMTLFWYNHIPVQFSQVFSGGHLYRYQENLRSHALGNFKELVRAVTIDPAMLFFLNGYVNSVYAPDENYAREIQELFVIGKDLPQYYTEDDVKAAARLLTGWRIGTNFTSYFDPNAHDKQDKQFSAFYGNRLIKGKAGVAGGPAELDEFLDMLFDHNEAARFVCRKLYRFFVYHGIDAQTEQQVIAPLADIFRSNNYDILPVLETLFKSAHFFDVLNRGAIIKSPLDEVVGYLRQMKINLPGAADLTDTFYMCYVLNFLLNDLLQIPGDPPNVAGWQAYYQKPVLDKLWINSSTLPRRGQINEYLLFVGLYGANNVAQANVLEFTKSLTNPGDPDQLISEVHGLLLGLPVSADVAAYHKSILLSNLPSAYYWTLAWDAYLANPDDAILKGEVENRLKILYHVIIQSEEYQLA